jgi:hypothetical protein
MANPAPPPPVSVYLFCALGIVAPIFTGCTVLTVAGKTVTTTVGVATDVTVATVRGTGKIAAAAVGASGDVADESVRVAAKLSKSGMVVFFDPKTGAVWEAPWRQGLKLYAAADAAKIDAAWYATRVIRGTKSIDAVGQATKLEVKSGDVIELARPGYRP